MKNEYNDYQIMSPSSMEKIAREYFNKINTSNSSIDSNDDILNLNNLEEYQNILKITQDIYLDLTSLKYYCSKRYFIKKEALLNSVLNKIKHIFPNVHFNESVSFNKNLNYCEIIKTSTKKLVHILSLCLDLFIKHPKKQIAHDMHTSFVEILQDIQGFWGECRYRRLF